MCSFFRRAGECVSAYVHWCFGCRRRRHSPLCLSFSCKWTTARCLPIKIEYNLIFSFSFIRFYFFSTRALLINRTDAIIFSQFHQQRSVQQPNWTTNQTETAFASDPNDDAELRKGNNKINRSPSRKCAFCCGSSSSSRFHIGVAVDEFHVKCADATESIHSLWLKSISKLPNFMVKINNERQNCD